MPTGLEDLLRDAAVLHGFVDFLEEYCKEQERSQTYVDASGLFFHYVKELSTGIKDELGKEISRATRFPARLPILRRNILTLKHYLGLLHALIKPAADAHTLTIPAPLMDLASKQLQDIEGMRNSKIVILLTPEFMYFQRPHTHVKEQARVVQDIIPQAKFPAKLGFIELPYSQGPSFFTNLAIYHEIGHFVYEELSNSDPLHPAVVGLRSVTNRSLRKVYKDRQVVAFASKIIENWTQEIFCDLFAIRLMGPASSFALVEILGMLGFLSPKDLVKFNLTHPASARRFAEHINLLDEDSWLKAIEQFEPEQKKVLERLAKIPRSRYRFYVDDQTTGPRSLVDTFLDSVVPAIRKLIRAITAEPTRAVKRFERERRGIEDCLRVGVVPHSSTSNPPSPISIINTAFCFYLTALPDVIKQFEGAEAKNDIRIHRLWTKRLEMWTMKAIEDSQIQDRFTKLKGTALWSFLEKKS